MSIQCEKCGGCANFDCGCGDPCDCQFPTSKWHNHRLVVNTENNTVRGYVDGVEYDTSNLKAKK